jgi:glycosyltransferase involved in cell wall biosynthesis
MIGELGLGGTVSLLGAWPPDDVADFVEALDVAVLSSHFEGMPLAAMEFMAAGKPVVATAVGGLPDLIGDGVHGLLVPPGDPEALAEALASLLHDPDRRAAMGRAGRERQRREFDFVGMVRKLEQRYEELLAGRISA